MMLIPYDKITIHSSKSVDDVLKAIDDNLNTGKVYYFIRNGGPKWFNGRIEEEKFIIARNRPRNNCVAVLKCTVVSNDVGSKVHIKSSLLIKTLIPLSINLSIILIIDIFSFLEWYLYKGNIDAFVF